MKSVSKAAALAVAACLVFPATALGEDDPNKLDITIVWSQENCEGIDISDEALSAAKAATADMGAEDYADSVAQIDEMIASAFEGDRAEYCLFVSEMAEGYPEILN